MSMMNSLSRVQREKAAQFSAVTGAPSKLATEYLRRHSWSLDYAVDVFFSEGNHAFSAPASKAPKVDPKRLQAFYQQYKDPSEESIQSDGIERLCADAGFSPMDPEILALCFHMKADQMGAFTKEEFCTGMQRLGVDSADKLRELLPALRQELADKAKCKEIYAFTFHFALDRGQKSLPVELCKEYWKLLLKAHFALLDQWLEFVDERVRNHVSRDTWMMLYDLATQLKPDLSDFDEDGAWPVVLDEFVEWTRAKQGKENQGATPVDAKMEL